MFFKLKAKLQAIIFFPAILSPGLLAAGSARDGNRIAEESRHVNVENQGGSRGKDAVYRGRSWVRGRLQVQTSSPVYEETRVEDAGLSAPRQSMRSIDELRSQQRITGLADGFQSVFTGHKGEEDYEEPGASSSYLTQEWFEMRPLVHCSADAMTLTVKGRGSSHLLVARADAAPVSVLHLPPDCGYSVKRSRSELVLTVSFDGCYVLKENGSHVLPLLWWGRPLKISCPVSSAKATPPGFCSKLGIAIMIERIKEAMEDYKVKVNGKWVPLVSDACAGYVDSVPEDLVFIPFTAPCIREGRGMLNVLLAGEEFILSCLPPFYFPSLNPHHSSESFKPLHLHQMETHLTPVSPSPSLKTRSTRETANPHVVLDQPYLKPHIPHYPPWFDPEDPNPFLIDPNIAGKVPAMQSYAYSDVLPHSQPAPPFGAPGTPVHDRNPSVPLYYIPQVPGKPEIASASPQETVPLLPCSFGNHTVMPMQSHHFNHFLYPMHLYPNPAHLPVFQQEPVLPSPDPTTKSTVVPISVPKQTTTPSVVPILQEPQVPQLLSSAPVFPTASFKMLPSTTCRGGHLVAALPSARKGTIKIKDVKKNVWVPLTSAPAHCGYSVQYEDWGVVFSSPLPVCHSRSLSSSVVSISLKFWDITQLRHRVLQVRCSTTEPEEPIPTIPRALVTTSLASQPLVHQIRCHSQHMSVILPPGPVTGLTVQTPHSGMEEVIKAMPLDDASSQCGYSMKRDQNGFINIFLPYSSCHMAYQDGLFRIVLKYWSAEGREVEALLSCEVPTGHECNLLPELQLACGSSSISAVNCLGLGCCYSSSTSSCYYPMNECTADNHFVFSISASLTDPPLSPALLVAAGNSSCTPQKVVEDSALFKIPLDSCGAHTYKVGKTVIYMLEVLNTLQSLSLNYGTITRDSPFRLLIECRYLPGTLGNVSYLVKSPSLGPTIQAQGVFGVQLRIAKDQHYRSYYPQYHRPLKKLVGNPLYLELQMLNPPDPSVKLLVHYCVAYPRSAQSAWVLIYDGCSNPLDVTSTPQPPPLPPKTVSGYVRRFVVSTFQFLDGSKDQLEFGENKIEEEIYFMCATEVCFPSEGPCIEGCFDNIVDSEAVKS